MCKSHSVGTVGIGVRNRGLAEDIYITPICERCGGGKWERRMVGVRYGLYPIWAGNQDPRGRLLGIVQYGNNRPHPLFLFRHVTLPHQTSFPFNRATHFRYGRPLPYRKCVARLSPNCGKNQGEEYGLGTVTRAVGFKSLPTHLHRHYPVLYIQSLRVTTQERKSL